MCKKKLRILVLGDSLCLPRIEPEKVDLWQTWPYLLQMNKDFEVIQLGIGGATIKDLYEQSNYYFPSYPDIVIIQSGIVDCAPRALGNLEKEIINSNRLLNYLFSHFFPIKFMRRIRKKTYTNANDFSSYISEFKNRFSNSKIVWIGIVPVSGDYEKKVPGILKNISKYNKIIAEKLTDNNIFCSTDAIPLDGIMSDHHHLSSIGHEWIFKQISRNISTKC